MVIEGTIKHKSKIGYSTVTTRFDNPYPFSAASLSPLFKDDSDKSKKLTKIDYDKSYNNCRNNCQSYRQVSNPYCSNNRYQMKNQK